MCEDLAIGDGTGDALAVFVDQYGGHTDDIGSGAAGVDLLNGMADGAGNAVRIKGTPLGGALGEVAGDHGDGVVAAFAMARELDALAVVEQIDVAQVPGGAVGIGVGGLTPLVLRFLMTVAAVLSGGKGFGINELTGVGGHERREKVIVLAEVVVVLLRYLRAVGRARGGSVVGFAACSHGPERKHGCQRECEIDGAGNYSHRRGDATDNSVKVLGLEIQDAHTEVDDTEFNRQLKEQQRMRKSSSFWRRRSGESHAPARRICASPDATELILL